MTMLDFVDEVFSEDIERFRQHDELHRDLSGISMLEALAQGLELLIEHPLVGHPSAHGTRELVIGRGAQGYVARYRYDMTNDIVTIIAIKHQRERTFKR